MEGEWGGSIEGKCQRGGGGGYLGKEIPSLNCFGDDKVKIVDDDRIEKVCASLLLPFLWYLPLLICFLLLDRKQEKEEYTSTMAANITINLDEDTKGK